MEIELHVNGEKQRFKIEGDETLLHVLRENGYTEVKAGCEEGLCGSCLVLLDGKPVNSCQVLAGSVNGADVRTVKGIDADWIVESLADAGAIQCGFCSPGFSIAIYAFLKENPEPDTNEIKRAIDGNLCRCTGYVKIIEGIKLAVRRRNERV